ncbi:MAG: hypothetical protein JWR86_572 [Enterovirga sp.]|jgi:DNA-directed RNA polymerase subunit RPC12/RpoP|nr:hypothetical protein [Enterovirga sp.]
MDEPDTRQPAGAPATPRIEVECLSCGRRGSLSGDDARVAGSPLVHLTRRLRCSECGSRAVKAKAVRTPADLARLMRDRMGRGC